MLTEEFENKLPRASVINGGLVLSFPNALTPVLWRHSLNTMDDLSFQRLAEGNLSILVIKTATGHLKEVARFASHEEGEKALQMATEALFTGGSAMVANGSVSVRNQSFSFANVIVFLMLAALLIAGAVYYKKMNTSDIQQEQHVYYEQQEENAAPVVSQDRAITPGVAVDVDTLF